MTNSSIPPLRGKPSLQGTPPSEAEAAEKFAAMMDQESGPIEMIESSGKGLEGGKAGIIRDIPTVNQRLHKGQQAVQSKTTGTAQGRNSASATAMNTAEQLAAITEEMKSLARPYLQKGFTGPKSLLHPIEELMMNNVFESRTRPSQGFIDVFSQINNLLAKVGKKIDLIPTNENATKVMKKGASHIKFVGKPLKTK